MPNLSQAVASYTGEVMQPPSEMMIRISEASATGLSGDRQGARGALSRLWGEMGTRADPLERVAFAHSMADFQEELPDELAWDLRALEAAGDEGESSLSRQTRFSKFSVPKIVA